MCSWTSTENELYCPIKASLAAQATGELSTTVVLKRGALLMKIYCHSHSNVMTTLTELIDKLKWQMVSLAICKMYTIDSAKYDRQNKLGYFYNVALRWIHINTTDLCVKIDDQLWHLNEGITEASSCAHIAGRLAGNARVESHVGGRMGNGGRWRRE